MPTAPPATVADMFVQTASGVRTDDGTMTSLGLTPHTICFSDRPERIVGHIDPLGWPVWVAGVRRRDMRRERRRL